MLKLYEVVQLRRFFPRKRAVVLSLDQFADAALVILGRPEIQQRLGRGSRRNKIDQFTVNGGLLRSSNLLYH